MVYYQKGEALQPGQQLERRSERPKDCFPAKESTPKKVAASPSPQANPSVMDIAGGSNGSREKINAIFPASFGQAI
jgi:hypothetical protein